MKIFIIVFLYRLMDIIILTELCIKLQKYINKFKYNYINMDKIKKIKLIVPEGIRFLSDWDEFRLSNFSGKCIINKQIPGCGFTEYCICGPENVILCSPRKLLLKNKYDQHENEVYLVVNEMDKDPNIDKDIDRIKKMSPNNILSQDQLSPEEKRAEIYKRLYSEIEEYKIKCLLKNKSMKILVTYDSYHIVVDILTRLNIFQLFYTVIDEFQSILHDARFKSDTEMRFMECLKQSPTSLFVSATPMLDEYLEMLSEFKDLPYYELDWGTADSTRVIKPDLDVKLMTSIGSKAEEIIKLYLSGNFKEVVVMREGIPTKIISKEAVIYVNSVNHIISIIKRTNLYPEQVNILCSDTDDNRKKIKKRLGKMFDIGSVPKKGKPHKMFTFCTRTVYLGADFYSTCARTFILSDSNSDCLAVDISEDLPQILGRQRLEENPWSNSAEFYYRTTADYRKMSAEDFQKIIDQKRMLTENLLSAFDTATIQAKQGLAKSYQDLAKLKNYHDDYVAVNKIRDEYGNVSLIPTTNELVLVNELRAFKIQQIDYKDRFTVFTTVHSTLTPDDIVNQEVSKFMKVYDFFKTRYEKLKYLCESNLSQGALKIVLGQISDSDEIKSYYTTLGPSRLRNLGYDSNRIKRELGIITFSPELLKQEIYSSFNEGERYTLSNLKNKLGLIYSSINYQSTPKAKDIENWFEARLIYVTITDQKTGKKKQTKGYELLKSKRDILEERLVD